MSNAPHVPSVAKSEITTVEARNNFSDVLNRAAYGKERVVLTRRGKAIAVIIPADDFLLQPPDGGTVETEI